MTGLKRGVSYVQREVFPTFKERCFLRLKRVLVQGKGGVPGANSWNAAPTPHMSQTGNSGDGRGLDACCGRCSAPGGEAPLLSPGRPRAGFHRSRRWRRQAPTDQAAQCGSLKPVDVTGIPARFFNPAPFFPLSPSYIVLLLPSTTCFPNLPHLNCCCLAILAAFLHQHASIL